MGLPNSLEDSRKHNSVFVEKNRAVSKKGGIVLPKITSLQTAPARIPGNLTRKKSVQDVPGIFRSEEETSHRKSSVMLTPIFVYQNEKNRLVTPSCSSPSNSDRSSLDTGDSEFSDATEFSDWDSGFLETMNKEVGKRVISGMVLSTQCGRRTQDILEKNLGKRVETFLGRSVPVSVISPQSTRSRHRLLTPLTSSRQQRVDTWSMRQQKISKVLSDSMRAMYTKSREGKCRYTRAPLTPIPSIDWVFDTCRKVDGNSSLKHH